MVIFSDEKKHLMTLHMMKYIYDHFADVYNWFYFAYGKTYVHGSKLMASVQKMSAEELVLLGKPTDDQLAYCDLSHGIIISQVILMTLKVFDCDQRLLFSACAGESGAAFGLVHQEFASCSFRQC